MKHLRYSLKLKKAKAKNWGTTIKIGREKRNPETETQNLQPGSPNMWESSIEKCKTPLGRDRERQGMREF